MPRFAVHELLHLHDHLALHELHTKGPELRDVTLTLKKTKTKIKINYAALRYLAPIPHVSTCFFAVMKRVRCFCTLAAPKFIN